MGVISIVHGDYKLTYNWGALPCTFHLCDKSQILVSNLMNNSYGSSCSFFSEVRLGYDEWIDLGGDVYHLRQWAWIHRECTNPYYGKSEKSDVKYYIPFLVVTSKIQTRRTCSLHQILWMVQQKPNEPPMTAGYKSRGSSLNWQMKVSPVK